MISDSLLLFRWYILIINKNLLVVGEGTNELQRIIISRQLIELGNF